LVVLDMAVQARLTDRDALARYASSVMGRPGVFRLRTLAGLTAPAESPMETRLRWLLLSAGLPLPQVQADLYDNAGEFVGRADLYYPPAHLVVEFDGGNHRDRLVDDNRRQNLILNAGYHILRFSGTDLRTRPDVVIAQVRAAMGRYHSTRC
jgi:hypothetical protein